MNDTTARQTFNEEVVFVWARSLFGGFVRKIECWNGQLVIVEQEQTSFSGRMWEGIVAKRFAEYPATQWLPPISRGERRVRREGAKMTVFEPPVYVPTLFSLECSYSFDQGAVTGSTTHAALFIPTGETEAGFKRRRVEDRSKQFEGTLRAAGVPRDTAESILRLNSLKDARTAYSLARLIWRIKQENAVPYVQQLAGLQERQIALALEDDCGWQEISPKPRRGLQLKIVLLLLESGWRPPY